MNADRWAVRLFRQESGFIGIAYFPTRKEARRFKSLLTLPSMQDSGLSAWVGRTGL